MSKIIWNDETVDLHPLSVANNNDTRFGSSMSIRDEANLCSSQNVTYDGTSQSVDRALSLRDASNRSSGSSACNNSLDYSYFSDTRSSDYGNGDGKFLGGFLIITMLALVLLIISGIIAPYFQAV